MSKTKQITIIAILIVLMICFSTIFTNVLAFDPKIDPDGYKPSGLTTDDYEVAFNKTKVIVNVIFTIGIVVSVIMTMVLGIRYMLAASAEQKADYQKTSVPMIIGIILIFNSAVFVKLFFEVFSTLNSTTPVP